MNKLFKRVLVGVVSVAMVAGFTAGCSSNGGSASDDGKVTVGVIQYATHPSLDNCYEGFKQGLEAGGFKEGENLTIEFQNAQAMSPMPIWPQKTWCQKNIT